MTTYVEKFIAFVDILGFKKMVAESEKDEAKLAELLEIVGRLGDGKERDKFDEYGPTCCPCAPRLAKNLDFRVTQISDCVIVSAEVSPAAVINLVTYCWQVVIRLLEVGVLCRGYISSGLVLHTEKQVIGSGYQHAFASEASVTAFRRAAEETGTPFVEIDDKVVDYISSQPDACVKMMFDRLTKFDGSKVALFPFKRLIHQFLIGGIAGPFDPKVHLRSVNNIRGWIAKMKECINRNLKDSSPSASQKAAHYLKALDDQLIELDETERLIRLIPKGTH